MRLLWAALWVLALAVDEASSGGACDELRRTAQREIIASPPHGLGLALQRLRATKAARLACGLLAVPPGGVRVRLRAGRYHAAAGGAALRLTPADSGLDGAPITYEPFGDADEVSISAGLAIPASAFTAWRGGIVKADLAALGLNASSLGSISRRCVDQRPEGFEAGPTMLEVFFADRAMPVSSERADQVVRDPRFFDEGSRSDCRIPPIGPLRRSVAAEQPSGAA